MPAPVAHFHPKPDSAPPAIVKMVTRQDAMWDRPIFKAPPLEVRPATLDATILADDLRQIGLIQK